MSSDNDKKTLNAAQTFDGYSYLANAILNQRGGAPRNNAFSGIIPLLRDRLMLDTLYRTSWITAKVIDTLAEDMTKDGIHITGLDPVQNAELQKYITDLGIWQSLTDTIKWSRLYGGAIGYIMINGQDPSTPLDITTITQNQFLGIAVFDRYRADPLTDTINPIDNEPTYYQLENIEGTIHKSRIIKMIGIKLPYYQYEQNQYWGDSVIGRVYQSVMLRSKALESTSKLINKAYVRTVKMEGLRNALAAGDKIQENIIHSFRIMAQIQDESGISLLDDKDTFQTDSYTFSGLNDLIKSFDQDVAGASDIPMTRLYGQSPAGFSNGESDLKTYYDKIATTQENMLREPLTKILNICYSSLYGTVCDAHTLDFDFNSAWKPNEIEDRNTTINELRLILDATNNGILPMDKALISLREIGKKYNLFTAITDDDIALNASIPSPPSPDDLLVEETEGLPAETDSELEAELNNIAPAEQIE